MKKLALLLTLSITTFVGYSQTWPISGWPYTVANGQYWSQSSFVPNYGTSDYNFYNFFTNSMINDVLRSTNKFYDAPPLDPNKYNGLNQMQYWTMLAQPQCTKIVTESIELSTEDGNFGINEDFDNVTISLYDNDNLNIRREAIREIINKVKNELTNRGIGMEMVNNIFVSASWRKPKAAEASTYIITYSYIVHVPCPPDFYTSGQSN